VKNQQLVAVLGEPDSSASKSQETKPLSFEFQNCLKILKNFQFFDFFLGARQLSQPANL